jgi:PTS system nitrogen regulatory IIA component
MSGDTPKGVAMKDLLAPHGVWADLKVDHKKQLIETLAAHAAGALGVPDHTVFDVLWERERLGTTGIGGGIAIPHGRMAGVKTVHGFVARLAEPVAYEATDDKPVDLVFLLLSPEDAGADHLHALACVSRLMRDAAFVQTLREAKDAKAMTALLVKAGTLKEG